MTVEYLAGKRIRGLSTDISNNMNIQDGSVFEETDTNLTRYWNSSTSSWIPILDLTFDIVADTSGGATTQASSKTVSVDVGTGNNRLLLVWVSGGGVAQVTTATYDGVSMTNLGTGTSGSPYHHSMRCFSLVNPSSGSNNLIVSQSSNSHIAVHAISFKNAHQSTPTIVTTNGGFASTTTLGITPTVAGSFILCCGYGASQITTNQPFNISFYNGFGGYHKTPNIGSNNNMTFTFSNQPYGAVAVAIKPI